MATDATYLFLDFDDTISDIHDLRQQFAREAAELLADEFGQDRLLWERAVEPTFEESNARYAARYTADPLAGYTDWLHEERQRIGEAVFATVGVPAPTGETLDQVVKRVTFDALAYCNAAFQNAEDALRELFEMGVRTQMASAQDSEYLLAALMGARLESYTESKFGPDLVNCAKESAAFYNRIFSSLRLDPARAIVVDDQAVCLRWAAEAGARVIQARTARNAPPAEFPDTITDLAQLPAIVRAWTA